jgi:hypothetical protein
MIPAALREKLVLNGCRAIRDQAFDPEDFRAERLRNLVAYGNRPRRADRAYGLCDLGLGSPELGYVSLFELASYRSRFGLPLERDRHFHARKPILEYAAEARVLGRIVA